jgi:hypothetical protein
MPAISSFATGDLLPIVDVSEISASDKNKSVTFGELFRNVLGGSASAPSIAFTGDQNTGIYSPGADQVAVATNGTGRLFVDASGNVGVGTSSVNALLEVNNSTAGGEVQRIEGNYSGSGSVILTNWRRAGGSVAAALKYNDDSSPLCMSIGTTTSHEFRIRTADTDAITIDTSQRVGIGTSSPSSTLHVAGPVTINNGDAINELTFAGTEFTNIYSDTTSGFQIGSTGAGYLALLTGNSERLRITSAGLVGIGNTAPDVNLVVEAATGVAALRVHAAENNPTSDPILILESSSDFAESTIDFKDSSGTGGAIRYNHGDNAMRFQTNGLSERARIDSSGRLLVGTSTARSNIARYGADYTPATQIQTNETSGWGTGLSLVNYSASGYAPVLTFGLSGSNTAGTNTLVASGDRMGVITFNGNDGTNFEEGARIEAQVDGTPGANDMPGRLVFSTTADGASSPTERMRIDNAGHVTIYKDASNLARLHLNGPSTRLEYSDSSGNLTFYTNSSPRVQVVYTGGFVPVTDNSQTLGTSGQRWTAVYAVNGTIQTSDLREKTDVATSSLGADFIKQLRPVSYKFKVGENVITKDEDGETDIVTPRPGERTHWGFVAQEVKEVVDAAGVDFGGWILTVKDDPDSTQGLRYDQFIAPLTKALQEALEKIETLEGMVAVNNITIDEQQHQLSTLAARLTALESA